MLSAAYQAAGQEALSTLWQQPRLQQKVKAVDTLHLTLPFFDDFANTKDQPSTNRWLNAQAYVNDDYAPYPPTIGMVTLDALDADGRLYPDAGTTRFSGDTLLSQYIRLDSLMNPRKRLTPADSVWLSFFYLPGGGYGDRWARLGDCPDAGDSLLVEFRNPATGQWDLVWATGGGISQDSLMARTGQLWQYAQIPITNIDYFSDRFQFRFRNYCSLDANPKNGIVGDSDEWNIDYILLSHGRKADDFYYRDVAFVEKATTLLKEYTAMPIRQYTPSDMAGSTHMTIGNRYSQPLASYYSFAVYKEDGSTLASYDGGYENVPAFLVTGNYQTVAAHANPGITFNYPAGTTPQTYKVVHVVREGVSGDGHTANDTTTFEQVFGNYYAYDDGIAENGYGLTTTSSRADLSCLFRLTKPDTLTALDICFNPTRDGENERVQFYIGVWSNNNGRPGSMIAKDELKQKVVIDGINVFHRYKLNTPIVISDSVFIGFEQTTNDYINIGFDRDRNMAERIYYRTSSEWQQSILSGALMMRPCFGASALVGIEQPVEARPDITVYPNPATDKLFVGSNAETDNATMQVVDMHGRLMMRGPYQSEIDVQGWPCGVYVLQIFGQRQAVSTTKFIISK